MKLRPYLALYAETDARTACLPEGSWSHVICIPAYKEDPDFLRQLAGFEQKSPTLCILNINAAEDSGSENIALTRICLGNARALPEKQGCEEWLSLHTLSEKLDVLVMDNCSDSRLMPPGKGVGLARKMACDLACRMVDEGLVENPWLGCTDADVHLPANYFAPQTDTQWRNAAALLYPFEHLPHEDCSINLSQQLYDFSLHYYVAGLAFAGSPYAFQTIGSTMAIHAQAYCKVRGFPKREAAEDFYMLNKLAKTGKVVSLAAPPISIDCRKSDRVPFGTGAAIGKLSDMQDPLAQYQYYNPGVFACLKTWLEILPVLESGKLNLEQALSGKQNAGLIHAVLYEIGAERALAHARQHSSTQAGFLKHMHDWFDAFRTLKYVHAVRDRHFGTVTLAETALATAVADWDLSLYDMRNAMLE